MKKFNMIHIFKSEVQIIGNENPGKVKKEDLTTLQDFIDSLIDLKPPSVTLVDYHVINVGYEIGAKYLGKNSTIFSNDKYWNVSWSNIDKTLLSNLIEEIESLI